MIVRAIIWALALCAGAISFAGGSPSISLSLVTAQNIGQTPLFVTHGGDGSGRIYIATQQGTVFVKEPGSTTLFTYLNIGATGGLDLITTSQSEQGLLGLAFHPNFATNRRFFVSYTRKSDGRTMVTQFLGTSDPHVADPNSRFDIMGPVEQPAGNHNGGCIAFGPDGMLYWGKGDGGGGNDQGSGHSEPLGNGQDTANVLGDLLRIDVDAAPDPGLNYHIPTDNPFYNGGPVPNTRQEIYAYGLRNPWRFSFDRGTGRLFLGDVGQGWLEEVDIIVPGGNYGWRRMEGTDCFNPSDGCQTGSLILPIAEYDHNGPDCSITGGYVYRGSLYPALDGIYFFGDACSGRIRTLEEIAPDTWVQTILLDTPHNISSFGEDEAGELYVCTLGGAVYQIVGPTPVVQGSGVKVK